MTDVSRLVDLVSTLCEAFNRKPTKATFAAYEVGLSDLPIEKIEEAVVTAIRESKFMPTVAELRQAAATGTAANVDDIAQHAFEIFDRAVQTLGGYKSPNFSDPITNATVRALGGWNYLCEKPESEFLSFVRPQFLKTYASFAKTGVGEEQSAPLIGIHDQKNLHAGYAHENGVNIQCGIGYTRDAVRLPPTTFEKPNADSPLVSHVRKVQEIRDIVIIKPVPGDGPPPDQADRLAKVMKALEYNPPETGSAT